MRTHITKKKIDSIHNTIPGQNIDRTPRGLWYSFDDKWIVWNKENKIIDYGLTSTTYHIDVDTITLTDSTDINKILSLRTYKEYDHFYSLYGKNTDRIEENINWDLVSIYYGGIEIPKYIEDLFGKDRRLLDKDKLIPTYRFRWVSGWAVASGCIWNKDVVKNYYEV